MENKKRSSLDDTVASALALRRWARSPASHHRLSLRRSGTASSTASSNSSVDEESQTSCAFRHTSTDECALYRFIVWAAVKRNACDKMTLEERRECPLLRCRKRFPNHELMLQHLYACSHLSGGEYWCYECGKPERINDAKCKRCLGHPSKRKKIISMAKNFFSSLGHKPKGDSLDVLDLEVEDAPPSYDSLITPPQIELPSNEIHELDSRELLPFIPEAASESEQDENAGTLSYVSPLSFSATPHSHEVAGAVNGELMRWGAAPSPPTVAPQNLFKHNTPRINDRPALQLHTHGLEQYRAQAKRRSKALAPSSSVRSTSSTNSTDSTNSYDSTASYEISPMSGWSSGWANVPAFESALTSPVDDLVSPGRYLYADASQGSFKPAELNNSELENMVANSFLSELPTDISMMDLLPTSNPAHGGSSLDQPAFSFDPSEISHNSVEPNMMMNHGLKVSSLTTQPSMDSINTQIVDAHSLVGSAQDALHLHIADSMMKLHGLRENHIADEFCAMSPVSVALTALETTIEVLEDQQPTCPVKLLCFFHFIYSLSLVVHEQDAQSRCSDLFTQALAYRSSVSHRDRRAFIEVVYCLWKPAKESGDSVTNLLQEEMIKPGSSQSRGKGKEPVRVFQGSGANPLVFLAQYFLDELDYSVLHDVNRPEIQASELSIQHIRDGLGVANELPFTIAAKFMIRDIFSWQFTDSPGFVSSLKYLLEKVNSGQVSTVRRLELELMQAGKTFLPANTFYDVFIAQARQHVDVLYSQDTHQFSPRLIYHRYGIQLMASLIRDDDSSTNLAVGDATQASSSVDPFAGMMGLMTPTMPGLDLNAMIKFDADCQPDNLDEPHEAEISKAYGLDQEDWVPGHASNASTSLPGAVEPTLHPSSPTPSSSGSTAVGPATHGKTDSISSSQAETTSANRVESNSCCDICGYRPRGDPRWFGGSMAKHKKLQHADVTKIYRCPYPGCTSQYSKRPDNLRQHQIEKGHFVDGQEPSNHRPRKRKWVANVE